MPALMRKYTHDIDMDLVIDPSFTGVLTGLPDDDVCEGCTLRGKVLLHVHRSTKVRNMLVSFGGKLKVNLGAPGMMAFSTPNANGTERRSLIHKYTVFRHEAGKEFTVFQPGHYEDQFEFELPGTLPASFKDKHGYVRYQIKAILFRSAFSNDLVVHREITIRRSVLDDFTEMFNVPCTIEGDWQDKINYKVTAPTIVYREGGLMDIDIDVDVRDPEWQVSSVTYGLQEVLNYRTTGMQALNAMATVRSDHCWPVGYATVPYTGEHIQDTIRLCPRVNADISTRLLNVSHRLIINLTISHAADALPDLDVGSPGSSACSSSASSIISMDMSTPSSSALSLPRLTTRKPPSQIALPTTTIHTIEVPLTITSRPSVWDGDLPTPPIYSEEELPPSYGQSIMALPRTPDYFESAAVC